MSQMTTKVARRMTLALTGWLLAACTADHLPTAPAAPANVQQQGASPVISAVLPTNGLNTVTTALTTVVPLGRLLPLSVNVSGSAMIGPRGGVLSVPALGVTLEVPAGAVDTLTQFSITALPGNALAYEFEPHGTTFKQPLVLSQRLGLTTWLPGLKLGGGYFKRSDQVDNVTRRARVNEVLPATVRGGEVILKLWHFSGYLVSMG